MRKQDINVFFEKAPGFVARREAPDARSWRRFAKSNPNKQWVYVLAFSDDVCAWGTASGNGERLIKTGMLQKRFVGKYDRRVDYCMLKLIYRPPEIAVFEFNCDARGSEQELRSRIWSAAVKGPCVVGIPCTDRDSMSRTIFGWFKKTGHWRESLQSDRDLFDEFFERYFLAKLRHPRRSASFYYGDCTEPGFLDRTFQRSDLVEAVERILGVDFAARERRADDTLDIA